MYREALAEAGIRDVLTGARSLRDAAIIFILALGARLILALSLPAQRHGVLGPALLGVREEFLRGARVLDAEPVRRGA